MAKGGCASVNGLEPYYKVLGEGGDFLPEEATAAIGDLFVTWSRP